MQGIEKLTISAYAKRYNKHVSAVSLWVNEGILEIEPNVVGTRLILDNDANRATLFSLTRRKKK